MSSTTEHKLTKEQLDEIARLKTDTSEEGREKYQNYTIDQVLGLHSVTIPVPQPCPKYETWDDVSKKCISPPVPAEGHIKPGGWGASQDAETWEVVTMLDDPTLFKVVDANNVNVAHNFNTKAEAEGFILYNKWKQTQTNPPPTCPAGQHWDSTLGKCVDDVIIPPPPPPTGDVKEIYPGTGAKAEFYYKSSNAGRAQWKSDLPKCWLSQEATAYLKIARVSNTGEEVSIKLRGGNHGSPASEGSCYIIGIGYDGSVNCQYEKPHPSNHSLSSTTITSKPLGSNIIGKWFGIKGIVYQQGNVDKIECWIDKGGLTADGKAINDWVKFWETTSNVFVGRCNGGSGGEKALIRLDDVSGNPERDVEIKFASVRELKPVV